MSDIKSKAGFNVGDRVIFNYPLAPRDGQEATVVKVENHDHASVMIKFDTGQPTWANPSELERVS